MFLPRHVVNRHHRRALLARRWWSRGAISIGADQSGIAPTILNSNGDTVVAAAGWTTTILSQTGGVGVPLIQRTNNDFYPYIAGVLAVTIGVAAPTAMQISYALVSGTPISTFDVAAAALVAATTVLVPFILKGPLSQSAYGGAGKTPLIEVNPTTNGVTVLKLGSSAIFQLLIGVE